LADDSIEATLKRRRDDEEWERVIHRKIETEQEIMKDFDSKKERINQEFFQLYHSLQCVETEYA
jgi:hypothetical protein